MLRAGQRVTMSLSERSLEAELGPEPAGPMSELGNGSKCLRTARASQAKTAPSTHLSTPLGAQVPSREDQDGLPKEAQGPHPAGHVSPMRGHQRRHDPQNACSTEGRRSGLRDDLSYRPELQGSGS